MKISLKLGHLATAAMLSLAVLGIVHDRADAWSGPWLVEAIPGSGGWAEAHGRGTNFDTAITVKCSADLAGIGITVRDYRGSGLGKNNGARDAVEFVIVSGEGSTQRFHTGLRFDADGDEWRTDGYDMPLSFLDAFARGTTMWLNGNKEEEVDAFTLKGSAAAARTMRATCWN